MKRICVFCGSNRGDRDDYADAVRALGETLARRGLELVFGGGGVGLMGIVADAVLDAGGDVIGVLPQALRSRELAHPRVSDMRIVASMHERKTLMAQLSDGFIAAPGGFGTLEELFEQLTWNQLGLHGKPCGVLNVAGYFDPLLAFLDGSAKRRFILPEHRANLKVAQSADALLDAFEAYQPSRVEKWLDYETS